jgi:anti-sigma B factor antagonist
MQADAPQNQELEIRGIKGVTLVGFPTVPILDDDHVEATALRLFQLVENLHGKALVLNFAHVEYISSRALGVMVSLYKKVVTRQKTLALCCVNDTVKELFRLVRLDHLFVCYDDEGKAIAAEKQEP